MSATLTFYGVVLSVHIMAVVVAFGISFAYPVFKPWARRQHPESMPVIHGMSERLGKVVMSPAIVVVLICGIYLASDARVWNEVWVSVPLVILIVIGGLGGAYFAPRERKLAELSERDLGPDRKGPLSAEYDELFEQVSVVAYANCALVLIAIFFMAAKP
jgi:uncharacterized membrane protein